MNEAHAPEGTTTSAAVALPLLGLFLLMPPVVTLFAGGMGVAGVPLIAIYLFGVWAALILCAGLLAWRLRPERTRTDDPADERRTGHPDAA
ncbi:MAG: hypothetical protein WCZ18_12425 [Ottowia sp.]|nr:hypothetical protein [Ottowia sp.]